MQRATARPRYKSAISPTAGSRAGWEVRYFWRGKNALGFAGPTVKAAKQFDGLSKLTINPGFARKEIVANKSRFVQCDISPLHTNPTLSDSFSGHHSDIFQEDLYSAIAGFLFGF